MALGRSSFFGVAIQLGHQRGLQNVLAYSAHFAKVFA
jgi:hypothetical protein